MERLSGLDASFLYNETPTLHMHTLKYAVLDVSTAPGGYSFERVVEELSRRLHLLPSFRRRLMEVPGRLFHPVWIEDPAFDIRNHVHRADVPAPGGRQEMDSLVAEIASRQLDRTRPLWEVWVLEGGADRDKIGFLTKVHHAVADGVAAAALLMNVTTDRVDAGDPEPPIKSWKPEPIPGRRQLLRDATVAVLANLRALPALLWLTAKRLLALARYNRHTAVRAPRPILDVPNTPFNGALSPDRAFATGTMPLADVKVIRAAFGVTVNDVILTVVGGAARAWLHEHGGVPRRSLLASVPVGTDPRGGPPRLMGNRVSNMFISLATDIADPVARLHAVHASERAAKQLNAVLGNDLLAAWSEYTPPALYSLAMRAYGRLRLAEHHHPPVNLVVSNVPGPREPLYVAGARMEGIWSVGPILEGVGLNVTVWSYVDDVEIGVLSCPTQIAHPSEIVDGLKATLHELLDAAARTTEKAADPPERPATVEP